MATVMGYADRFTVRPGERLELKVSVEGADAFDCRFVRLTGPDAGPIGPEFAPEPVDTPANGRYPGRRQPVYPGSFAAVASHPLIDRLESVTATACVLATTPGKGRQAILGCWSEAEGRGFLLGIDAQGRLEARVGDLKNTATLATADAKLPERRWMFVAMRYDATKKVLAVYQWPARENRFDTEVARAASTTVDAKLDASALPCLVAAWQERVGDGPTCWGRTVPGGHFNGKIDRPRIAGRALSPSDLRMLAADRILPELAPDLVAAWDYSRGIPTETVTDTSPNRLDGVTVNLPARGMTGHNWTGEVAAWPQAPDQYGAIHFHDDDIVDCLWDTDVVFEVPDGLRSGIYCARLAAGEAAFDVPFVVSPPLHRPRPATDGSDGRARIAFLAASATYTVYLNNRARFMTGLPQLFHGRMTVMDAVDELLFSHSGIGLSTYCRHSDGSGVCYSSRARPATNIRPTGRLWNFNTDLFILHWLETVGEPYEVITDDDLHRHGLALLRDYRVVLTGSHPEYDSKAMLDALDGFLRVGGRLMYLGGNGFYWRIAFHPTRDGVIEVRRPEDGIRAWIAEPGEGHLSFTGEPGGLWRRHGRPPNALAGVGFISQGFDASAPYRRRPEADDPRAAFIFDGVDDEILGDFGALQGGAAGLEIDSADPRLGTPPHALIVARSENHSNTYELVPEEVGVPHGAMNAVLNPAIHADMVFFETPGGGAVWSSGSIAYAGALGWNGYDNNIARLTTNVLRRFADGEPFDMPG